jgi:hypothetical protein
MAPSVWPNTTIRLARDGTRGTQWRKRGVALSSGTEEGSSQRRLRLETRRPR